MGNLNAASTLVVTTVHDVQVRPIPVPCAVRPVQCALCHVPCTHRTRPHVAATHAAAAHAAARSKRAAAPSFGQVVDDMPAAELTKHDVPVDVIVTPTRVIRVPNRVPKPSGVFWDLLSPQKLAQIKVCCTLAPCTL